MDIKRIVVCLVSAVMLVTMLLPADAPPVMAAGLQEQHQQYQNGADTKTPEWANVDINKSNSNYAERDSVPYRYEFKDVRANACLRFEIHYDFTKGGQVRL